MKSVRLFFCLAVTGFAFVGCPPDSTIPDEMDNSEPDSALSYLVVIVEFQSTAGLSEIVVDDLSGGVTLFPFQPVLPPGTRGEACCVSPGVYDVIFEMEGVGFTTFEMQELLPEMDHIYTVTITSDEFVLTSMRVEPHIEE